MKRRQFLFSVAAGGAGVVGSRLARASFPASSPNHFYADENLPDELHAAVLDALPRSISVVAFPPCGGFVVVSGDGTVYQDSKGNIPAECISTLRSMIADGERINCVAFPPAAGNSWVIVGETSIYARNIPDDCYAQLCASIAAGDEILSVAFHPLEGWVILTYDTFWASGSNVTVECQNTILNFMGNNGRATWPRQLAFTPDGSGWVLLGRGGLYFARNILNDCYSQLQACVAQGYSPTCVAFTSDRMGFHVSGMDPLKLPPSQGGTANVRATIDQRQIPGVAAVVIKGDAVFHTDNFGVVERGSAAPVNSGTRFQCASISKVVTAVGVLRLLDLGLVNGLTLDTDISNSFGYTIPVPLSVLGAPITLRQLLSHTAGINVPAFDGYRRTSALPTTLQILQGHSPANSQPVARMSPNGATKGSWSWTYSGGGMMLIQSFIEQATGTSFASWITANVLVPLGMTSSSYAPADTTANESALATAHEVIGYPTAMRRNNYPEHAAAGLYTTALDLASLVAAINRGGYLDAARSRRLWSTNMLVRQTALTDPTNWGLGVALATAPATFGGLPRHTTWSYSGTNLGFRSSIWGDPLKQTGVVLLANFNDRDANGNSTQAALTSLLGSYRQAYSL